MAKVIGFGEIKGEVTLVLSETEARALDALVGYGVRSFLQVFYEHLGRSYLEPHERGLRSLFDSVRTGDGSVSQFLQKVQEARAVFSGKKVSAYRAPEYEAPPQNQAPVDPVLDGLARKQAAERAAREEE